MNPPSQLVAIDAATRECGFEMPSVPQTGALLIAKNGVYLGDDLLPQDNWPLNHAPKVPLFIEAMKSRPELLVEYREWSSGILLARKQESA